MQDGIFRRRRLPHWDVEDAIYFVTTCLADSIPAQGLLRLERLRARLESQRRPEGLSTAEWRTHKHKLIFAQFDATLDTEAVVRHLANPGAASEVDKSIKHFAGDRYDLLAYVVMPSHFHWVFRPRWSWLQTVPEVKRRLGKSAQRSPRELIMKNLKGYSAYQCNRVLRLDGSFWQDESYDHVVRDDEELLRIIRYVENNPVKAGLVARPEDWKWSSAGDRVRLQIAYGEPLRVGQAFLSANYFHD